jgi:serine/threonine protein phosphatase 1
MRATNSLIAAVGDIHGDLASLDRTIAAVEQYADGRPLRTIYLGDYVDRGPDSRGVVSRLMERTARGDIALKGNHEAILLAALSDKNEDVRFAIDNGGYPTLLSYGIQPIDFRLIPKVHTDWMRQLQLSYDDGLRFFCHAPINPARALDDQLEKDLLWTRDLIPLSADLPRLIVHGHIIQADPFPNMQENSINLDTGCGAGGPLSAAVFDGSTKQPIAVVVDGDTIECSSV